MLSVFVMLTHSHTHTQSLLNFRMDGGGKVQVFEGVDYSDTSKEREKELARLATLEILTDVRVCVLCNSRMHVFVPLSVCV